MDIKVDKFFFKDQKIFDSLFFSIERNIKYSISGPNGTGKTTLLRILMEEIKTKDIHISDSIKNRIYYNKDLNIQTELSLLKNMEIFRKNYDHTIFKMLCNGMNFVEINKKISNLSEGNKTKALLISIFSIKNYDLVVLDEPTENLDVDSTNFLENYLKEINKTIVLVSHNSTFRNGICDRFIEINNHNLILNG